MQGRNSSTLTKAPPHNSAARLAMPFPPSAACKFLDLPPVNLRNLHLHLTKNPFASRPPHLCGVTLKNLRNKPSSMRVSAPKGSRGRSESPLVASAEAISPCSDKNQETWECNAKVSKGRPQSPLVASAEAISPCSDKNQETWECNAKVSKGRPQSPLVASAEAISPCSDKNQETWECNAKVSKGRPQSPLVASAEAKPSATIQIKQHR